MNCFVQLQKPSMMIKKRYDDFECLSTTIWAFYTPSIFAYHRLTNAKKAQKLTPLDIADLLSKRYCEMQNNSCKRFKSAGIVFIIDCLMNLPLCSGHLQTGDRHYYLKALNHVYQAIDMIRDDASTIRFIK